MIIDMLAMAMPASHATPGRAADAQADMSAVRAARRPRRAI